MGHSGARSESGAAARPLPTLLGECSCLGLRDSYADESDEMKLK